MPDVNATVFVVVDDISVRESLELLIKSAGWRPETFASAQDFLSRPRATVPCCLVLDVSLPGLTGLELQQLAERTDMPIIFITGYGDVPMTVRAMKAGAVEFLTKPFKDDVLLDAIRSAIERSRVALQQESEMQLLRSRYGLLTPREREVMALVCAGPLNKQVGGELGISEITVKAHRGQMMRKMKADSCQRPIVHASWRPHVWNGPSTSQRSPNACCGWRATSTTVVPRLRSRVRAPRCFEEKEHSPISALSWSGGNIGDRTRGVLIGATLVTPRAGEIVGELVLAIKLGTPLTVLADVIHPFPAFNRILGASLEDLAAKLA
jgi:FixJ family two-component response regulator